MANDPKIFDEILASDRMGSFMQYTYNLPGVMPDDPTWVWEQIRWNPWVAMAVFDDMEAKDPTVSSLLDTRKDGVLAKSRNVLPASDKRQDKRNAEFIDETLGFFSPKDTDAGQSFGFDNFLYEALDATGRGVAVGEIIYGDAPDRVFVKDVRFKPQQLFCFGDTGAAAYSSGTFLYPQTGALRLRQGVGAATLSTGDLLPERKFFVHTFRPRYSNRWGSAQMLSIFWTAWFKRQGVRQWLRNLEKGNGSVVARYPDGSSVAEQDTAHAAAQAINEEAAVAIPQRFALEVLQHVRNSGGQYKEFADDFCNAEMARKILGQTLTSRGSDGGGSRALGEVHNQVRGDKIEADAKSLMHAVNTRIIFPLHLLNNGPVGRPPLWVINYDPGQDLIETVGWLTKLWEMHVPISRSYVYNTFKLPEIADGDADVLPPPSADTGARRPTSDDNDSAEFAEAKKKTAEIERHVREAAELEDGSLRQAAPIYDDIIGLMIARLVALDDLRGATGDLLDRFDGSAGDLFDRLSSLLADALLASYLLARYQLAENAAPAVAEFADPIGLSFDVPPREAIEWFRAKRIVPREEFDDFTRQARAGAFTVGGIYRDDVLEAFKEEIAQSLEKGTPQAQVVSRFREILDGAGHKQLGTFHLETVFRTNMQAAYGTGRRRALEASTDLLPYWTYHAVLDDRTRPHHAALDGIIYPADHPFWDAHFPPWGFNCRCSVSARATMPVGYDSENPSGQAQLSFDDQNIPVKAEYGTQVIDLSAERFVGIPPQGRLRDVIERGAERALSARAKTPRAVIEYEDTIADEPKEHLSAFDRDGKLLYRKSGERDRVYMLLTEQQEHLIRGGVLTHNHPRFEQFPAGDPRSDGNSFSLQDILTAADLGLGELRAVSQGFRFSMRPARGGWSAEMAEAIRRAFDENHAKVSREFEDAVYNGEMRPVDAEAFFLHEVWRRVAKQLGFRYARTKR